jgi:serine/threonine protein kinase/formylglycine-generating enzyme required for sulfatase activity
VAVELAAGAIIAGKLRLLRPLGQGGMGIVWAARHETLETDVAVKLIRPERVAADPALIARFEREAKTTARIAHPHVVHVMDYGTVDGVVPFIVMELLGGFSLAELLDRGGRLSLATAAVLVQQMASALESAHERGVVHRDIKPHNVFILEESQGYPLFLKVLDFGIAKMLGDSQVPSGSHTLTETGTIIGSPPYMSPEQIEGSKDVDLRADLWSLGVIVYESLTGQRPFRGSSFVAVGAAALKGRYEPATELRPGLPRSIDDWFAKALSVDPGGRFQSAAEMAEAFRAVLHSYDADAFPSEGEPRASPTSAFATTVDAAPLELAAGPDRTVSHAPVAENRGPLAPRKRTRRAVVASLAGALAIAVGVAVSALAGTGTSAACPAGMLMIDGATFEMGSAAEGETPNDETPRHAVTLRSFCLDKTEVTVGDYAKCTSCEAPVGSVQGEGLTQNAIKFWSRFCNPAEARDHPINCIDWTHANAFCEAAGKRLPSEAEWELAARGDKARTYPWGEAPPSAERLNACGAECSRMLTEQLEKAGRGPWPRMYPNDDSATSTAPVGRLTGGATLAGVSDLAGNVWEWTSSRYCRYDEPDCEDSRRVIRGGGWDTVESQDVRAARRLPSAPSARSWSVGFRCAKSP